MAKKSILRKDLEKLAESTLTPEQRAELNQTEKMGWTGEQVVFVKPSRPLPKPKKEPRQRDAGTKGETP